MRNVEAIGQARLGRSPVSSSSRWLSQSCWLRAPSRGSADRVASVPSVRGNTASGGGRLRWAGRHLRRRPELQRRSVDVEIRTTRDAERAAARRRRAPRRARDRPDEAIRRKLVPARRVLGCLACRPPGGRARIVRVRHFTKGVSATKRLRVLVTVRDLRGRPVRDAIVSVSRVPGAANTIFGVRLDVQQQGRSGQHQGAGDDAPAWQACAS